MFFGRRVRFAVVILASHLFLIALALMWFIQLYVIARDGSVRFVESDPKILVTELVVSGLICIFSIAVFAIQILKLRERRQGDENKGR